jgi:hypothetical protein
MVGRRMCQLEKPSGPGEEKLVEEVPTITVSGKCRHTVTDRVVILSMGVQQNAPGGKGPDR